MRAIEKVLRWLQTSFIEPFRNMRLEYLPPLMVYMAAGISALTSIVGTFYVKERLGLSAEFLAALGFWVGMPWALKMPIGHIVDLIWRFKGWLIFLGAGLIATSLSIMVGLLSQNQAMLAVAPVETWFVLSTLLAPVGYVLQDVVADAMTVEAVPLVDERGNTVDGAELKKKHTTMQTLGRVAIMGGSALVSLINVYLMDGVDKLSMAERGLAYLFVYQLALVIPLVSVCGVLLASFVKWRKIQSLTLAGHTESEAKRLLDVHYERPSVNWWILGGSLVFVVFSLAVGLSKMPGGQEITFFGTAAIVIFLMLRLMRELDPRMGRQLIAVAVVVFVFRAMPGIGAGASWWQIDVLLFDQQFLALLGLIGSTLGLLGMFFFQNFMAKHSIPYIYGFLTIVGAILFLPFIGLFYGLHIWTALHTGGIVDARSIALIDTAVESPLGQISMIPMLAWIANSAPAHLKATFFAVMASFTNLALSASALGTKYLNQIFAITREVKNEATGLVSVPADYSELGMFMITTTVLGLVLPLLAILWHRWYARRQVVPGVIVCRQ